MTRDDTTDAVAPRESRFRFEVLVAGGRWIRPHVRSSLLAMVDEPARCHACREPLLAGRRYSSVNVHEEIVHDGVVRVLEARTALVFCEVCSARRDFARLGPPPERPDVSIDAGAQVLADAYAEHLGHPETVLHPDGDTLPHVDVYIYPPQAIAPGWMSVTAGRSLAPLAGGRHVELVQHLRPDEPFVDVAEAAEVLRRVAEKPPALDPRWRFEPAPAGVFDQLAEALEPHPDFLQAIFRR